MAGAIDRLSDHRFMANLFGCIWYVAAMNLVRLRREIVNPPIQEPSEIPVEALVGKSRKKYQNARRRRDPLGEGQPHTWRLLFIKVAATVVVSTFAESSYS